MKKTITLILFSLLMTFPVWGKKSVLRVPIKDKIYQLNPYLSVRTDLNRIIKQVFEGLVDQDGSGHVRPILATSWEINPDKKEIKFILKEKVRFSDGTLLTPKHVVRSLKESIKQGNQLASQIKRIAIRKGKVIITNTNKNFSLLLRKLATQEGVITHKKNGLYLGTGPYKVTRFSPSFIRVSRYQGISSSNFPTIEFKHIERKNLESAFLKGEVDELNTSSLKTAKEKNLPVLEYSYPGTLVFIISQKSPLFSDLKERKHFMSHFNNKTWLAMTNRKGELTDSLIPRGMLGHQEYKKEKEHNERLVHKPIKIGLVKGFLIEGGEELLSRELKRMGYNATFVYDSFTKLLKKFKRHEIDGTFKMDSAHFFDSTMMFNPYLVGSNNNIHGTNDKVLNQLYRESESELNSSKKVLTLRKMEERLRELAIVAPMIYPKKYLVFSKKVNTSKLKDHSFSFWTFNYHNFVMSSN